MVIEFYTALSIAFSCGALGILTSIIALTLKGNKRSEK